MVLAVEGPGTGISCFPQMIPASAAPPDDRQQIAMTSNILQSLQLGAPLTAAVCYTLYEQAQPWCGRYAPVTRLPGARVSDIVGRTVLAGDGEFDCACVGIIKGAGVGPSVGAGVAA